MLTPIHVLVKGRLEAHFKSAGSSVTVQYWKGARPNGFRVLPKGEARGHWASLERSGYCNARALASPMGA